MMYLFHGGKKSGQRLEASGEPFVTVDGELYKRCSLVSQKDIYVPATRHDIERKRLRDALVGLVGTDDLNELQKQLRLGFPESLQNAVKALVDIRH